jgi:hypothetical protein
MRATPTFESISIPDRSHFADVSASGGSDGADPGLTIAEKVYALTPKSCRWPYGEPGHPDFHFCGNPVIEKPYCEHHRAVAHAGGGDVAHGRQPPRSQQTSARASSSTRRAFFPLLLLRPPKVISLAGGLPCSAQPPSQSRASPC